jgi:hypothetical protein
VPARLDLLGQGRVDGTFAGQLTVLTIAGICSDVLLENTGVAAGQAYGDGDLLLRVQAARVH